MVGPDSKVVMLAGREYIKGSCFWIKQIAETDL